MLAQTAVPPAYPVRTVSLMVPYPAGGASDVTARALNGLIGKHLNAQVIVENLGGASGALGANKVLAAPADGYYVFQGSPNELVLSGLTNKGVKYKPEDFQFVAPVATSPFVVVTRPNLQVNSVDELVALARQRKQQPLTFGSVGQGSMVHLLGELLSKRVGAAMTHVPYKGAAPLNQDLIGEQIDFAIMPYQAAYGDFAKQGRLKILASLAKEPPASLKDVPTTGQSQSLKDFDYTIWTAYMVKAGTPRPIVERLQQAIAASLQDPAARGQLEAQGKTVYAPMTVAEGERFYAAETARLRSLVKDIGYEAE